MKTFTILIQFKDLWSKNHFFSIFEKNSLYKLYYLEKHFSKKIKNKRITLLKSPHVNKKSQEQFETHILGCQVMMENIKNFKNLVWLKKCNCVIYSDIWITLKYRIKKEMLKKWFLYTFGSNLLVCKKEYNFNDTNIEKKVLKTNSKLFKKTVYVNTHFFLRLLDSYGENFKTFVWIAQLVEQRIENPCDSSSNLLLNDIYFLWKTMYQICLLILKMDS